MDLNEIKKPKLYTINEAKEALGVSYHTLFRMIHNGKIKAVNTAKTGTRPRWGIAAETIQHYYDFIQDSIKQHSGSAEKEIQSDNPEAVH